MVFEKTLKKPAVGILTGPTGTGKTALALQWCRELKKNHGIPMAIINADSLLFYKEFDIGTAKPKKEELEEIPHYLINHLHPENENYSSGDFIQDVFQLIPKLTADGFRILIVGGSGFYIKPLLYGHWNAPKAPESLRKKLEEKETPQLWEELLTHYVAHRTPKFSSNDRYRIIRALEIIHTTQKTPEELEVLLKKEKKNLPLDASLWVIDRKKEELQKRVLLRTREMLQQGWIDEVIRLQEKYPNARAHRSVGYKEIHNYLKKIVPQGRKLQPGIEGLLRELEIANNQLIKKQRTWFRSEVRAQNFLIPEDEPQLKKTFMKFFLTMQNKTLM